MGEEKRVRIQVESEQLVATGISDIGLFRKENQDSIFLDKKGHFALLADGMGGHERGAEASQIIIEVLKETFQPDKIQTELNEITSVEGIPIEVNCLLSLIDKGVRKSNDLLYKKNRTEGVERFMGSTLVGLVITMDLYIAWFHVGDSRLYRWRDSVLSQLTEDHSAYVEWIKRGRMGKEPGKNIVTRAIGPKEGVLPDINWEKSRKDDMYILCSDGLTDMIDDEEISNIIKNSDSVDNITLNLLNAALDAGGTDNTSVVVCRL